jgi:hypothetical protein
MRVQHSRCVPMFHILFTLMSQPGPPHKRESPTSTQHSPTHAAAAVAAAAAAHSDASSRVAAPEDVALSPILRDTVSPDPPSVSLQAAAQVAFFFCGLVRLLGLLGLDSAFSVLGSYSRECSCPRAPLFGPWNPLAHAAQACRGCRAPASVPMLYRSV